jgi:hypothetical protein
VFHGRVSFYDFGLFHATLGVMVKLMAFNAINLPQVIGQSKRSFEFEDIYACRSFPHS